MRTKSATSPRLYQENTIWILICFIVLCSFFLPVNAAQPTWKYTLSPDVTYEGNLNIVKISDDGQYLAVYVADQNTLLYFSQSGTLLWSEEFVADHRPWISSVSIAHDNSIVAVSELVPGCCEGSISNTTSNRIILFGRNGSELWNYTTLRAPLAVAISPDSSRIYAGTDDRQVICLDRNGTVQWRRNTDAPVYSLAVSGDSSTIAAAGTNPGKTSWGTVIYPEDLFLFDQDGSPLWKFQTGGPNTVAISSDGSKIAVVGGKYGNLYLFNKTGNIVNEHSFRETGSSLAMSKDAGLVVVGSLEGSLYGLNTSGKVAWNIRTPRLSRNVAVAGDGNSVAFGNGRSIMISRQNGSVVLDYPTGTWISSVTMSDDGHAVGAISDAIYFFNSTGNSFIPDMPGPQEKKPLLPEPNTSGSLDKPASTQSAPLPVSLVFSLVLLIIALVILKKKKDGQ